MKHLRRHIPAVLAIACPLALVRVPMSAFWKPDAQSLGAFVGTYYSADLGNAWTLARSGAAWVLRRAGPPDEPLTPIAPDRSAAVTAFTVTVEWIYETVRDLRFDRIPP